MSEETKNPGLVESGMPVQEPVRAPEPEEETDSALEDQIEAMLEPGELANRFWRIIDVLSADETREIIDADGNRYTARTTIAMRKQMIVFRCIRELMAMRTGDGGAGLLGIAGLAKEGDIAAMLVSVLEVIEDDRVIELVDKAFTVAFPQVVQEAVANAGDNGEPVGAVDLFPVEEIVGALLPFAARLVRRIVPSTEVETVPPTG